MRFAPSMASSMEVAMTPGACGICELFEQFVEVLAVFGQIDRLRRRADDLHARFFQGQQRPQRRDWRRPADYQDDPPGLRRRDLGDRDDRRAPLRRPGFPRARRVPRLRIGRQPHLEALAATPGRQDDGGQLRPRAGTIRPPTPTAAGDRGFPGRRAWPTLVYHA